MGDFSGTLNSATALPIELAKATDTPTLANTTGVETGSTVNGIFLNIQVASNETEVIGAVPNVYLAIFKNVGGNLTGPSASAVGASDNKRFVIHQEMIMMENSKGGNPKTLFKGVFAIPKGYRRFAPNDILQAIVLSPSIDIVVCSQAIYKEFR